uniref:Uncharacterized protein LOC104210984 n=1 Tax=Nicotiana sylvestris TaxID=4096 RepID=A0A1U7UQ82_NICSY|nr:PREDICTED: uncharacterized protein LOC104210984 [Nicotiana sylvestris]
MKGICGILLGADSLVLKLVRAGYYWPWMEQDAKAFVQKYKVSKPHVVNTPTGRTIAFNIVALAIHEMGDGHSLSAAAISRFRVPNEIACNNGLQFTGVKIKKFFEDVKIKRITSLPYHPSANGQEESTNKVIIQNLKKRLEASKGK